MAKILVTGSDGLVGTAIRAMAVTRPQHTFYFATRKDADLTLVDQVEQLFATVYPDYVIHAAAKVGGIFGNQSSHGEYFYNNTLINAYMLHYAMRHKVQKMLAFSSVCVFPDGLALLQEDKIHDGPVYGGNFAYGYAKRNVDVQIRAYQSQYGVENWCSVIPGNIFGKADLYNLQHAHVIPALIHKIYLAHNSDAPVVVAGDGLSLREFIYSEDLALALLDLLELPKLPTRLIISGNRQYSIREIVAMLCRVSEFDGPVRYDITRTSGQRARPSDLSLCRTVLGDMQYTPMTAALRASYDWFVEHFALARK